MAIELPLPYKVSTNAIYAGMHWTKRKKIADVYHRALLPFKNTKIPTPAYIDFTFEFKGRLLDCSNCSFMVKCLEDGMVAHGLLPGDAPKYVDGISTHSKKGNTDRVIIDWV